MHIIHFPAIAPLVAYNFSLKTVEFKLVAVSVERSICNMMVVKLDKSCSYIAFITNFKLYNVDDYIYLIS